MQKNGFLSQIVISSILAASPQFGFAALGGQRVAGSELISAVHLNFSTKSSCSGAVISDNLILTAGHCLDQQSPKKVEVSRQTSSQEWRRNLFSSEKKLHTLYRSHSQEFKIRKIYLHPQFAGDMSRPKNVGGEEVSADVVLLETSGGLFKFLGVNQVPRLGGGLMMSSDSIELFSISAGARSKNETENNSSLQFHKVDLKPVATKNGYSILTATTNKDSLCKGDSGSAVYRKSADSESLEVVAILSGVTKETLCGRGPLRAYVVNLKNGVCQIASHYGMDVTQIIDCQ